MSSPALAGKVAIITGGTKGIGAATAKRLVREGAKVVINYGSDTAAAEKTVQELDGTEHAFVVQADAGSVAGVTKIVESTVAKFGKIDIVICNAGVLPMVDLEHLTEEQFDKTYAVNVKGPLFLTQKAVPHMPEGGRVVLLSTSLVRNSLVPPNYLLYNSTKGAIDQITRLLAKDLGRKKITVNAIAPGPTGTELFYKGKTEEALKMMRAWSPFNKLGEPEEIANAIYFAVGPDSGWVSGQNILVNGASVV